MSIFIRLSEPKLFCRLALSLLVCSVCPANAQFLHFDAPTNNDRRYDLEVFNLDAVSDCVMRASPELNTAMECYVPFLETCITDIEVAQIDACEFRARIIWAGLASLYANHEEAQEVAEHFDPFKCDNIPYELFDQCLILVYANRAIFWTYRFCLATPALVKQ